jgi:tetratricopeptide (TPR) repeat protein
MTARPLTLSPSYLATVRGTHELHRLIAEGKEDGPEAEAIRDASDGPWEALSETERARARWVAEDLYSLYEEPPARQEMTSDAQARLNEVYEARERGEWDLSLQLLRTWRAYFDPFLVSYLRGTIWLDAGDPATAALFFQHAHKLNPGDPIHLAMFLYALSIADPPAALTEAENVLRDYRKFSPVVYVRAADIKFMSARLLSEAERNQIFLSIEPVLKEAIHIAETESQKVDGSTVVMALGLLGVGYEFLGRWQDAVDQYSTALHIDPENDGLLVARGILLYGAHDQAIADLERAVELSSPLIWPYAFLAHHALKTQRYRQCMKLCEKALDKKGSAAVMSEIREWEAIAQATLEFSPRSVEHAFEQAMRTDAANDRAKRNLKKVKGAPRKPPPSYWEVRSEAALRTSGIVERRYAMADVSNAPA